VNVSERKITFDDGAAYQRFMGRWSQAGGKIFLAWLAPPKHARWLDVGCGTGVFTEQVLDTCKPSAMVAVDPSKEQVEYARSQPVGRRAEFKVADAQALPFSDGEFDVAAAALVINFVPDRLRAVSEMKRITRKSGLVAAYVWDFASGHTSGAPFNAALKEMGYDVPPMPGSNDAVVEAFHTLFERAGLAEVASRHIDIDISYSDFDHLWESNVGFSTFARQFERLPEADRPRFKEIVGERTPRNSSGRISYLGRFSAAKGRVP
jgi:ubiquinone/menaquinone biosynthesis C-methylase UbiE